jgi:serine beta-lactamase-like protein LACTB, mitochondrial
MKGKILFGILISAVVLTTGCQRRHEKKQEILYNRKYIKVLKEARREAFYYLARNFVPGSSVALSINGKLVWSEGFGQANTDLEVPATRSTKYRIGQISQVLTSICYYKMVEEGKLSPTEIVWKYYPEYPEKEYPLQLQHLVDQTSGIRQPDESESAWRGLNVSLQRGIESFAKDTLLFPPGMFQFSTPFSYDLLGAIMEKVSGQSFANIVSHYVTDTLHLENTVPDNPLVTIKDRSSFFDLNMVAMVVHATTMDFRFKLPAEGYLSTAEDLIILGNALLDSPFLSDTIKNRMFRAPVLTGGTSAEWGNGLMFIPTFDGNTIYASRGQVKGSGAMLLIYPEEKLVLAWLSNLDDSSEELPGLKVANMFIDFLHGRFGKKPESDTSENK